jgi:hypothetical protein
MRLAVLTMIGALGLTATTLSAQAAPFAPPADHTRAAIIQVYGGCGPGYGPVPGHWRGPYWVPPHCGPLRGAWGPRHYWRPYWRHYW